MPDFDQKLREYEDLAASAARTFHPPNNGYVIRSSELLCEALRAIQELQREVGELRQQVEQMAQK